MAKITKILFFIAPKNFRDEELFDTRKVIEKNKECVKIEIASITKGRAVGMLDGRTGIDLGIDKIKIEDYKAIIFVGGKGVFEYRLEDNKEVLDLAKKAYEKGLLVCAICAAPRILANAGLLNGRKATVFNDNISIKVLEKGKAIYTGNDVEIDGRIITADGPRAANKFGQKIVENL